ncbi:MAG TPA: bifunctional 5,10-methylenetetrahydrofolate dehydrogenase/5,10-methenyltetrahydrofolate cyclohydrolase [Thermoplasmata archaeon]|nr:bifunctional 5,10-methylenetetrahydrofolate dehydrogenase/5,10-methenyltetrahydrofolate cyclohydrolase [Thermoplasmata archaeon]
MTSRWDGRAVAESLLEGARAAVRAGVSEGGRPPRLVSVHRGGASPFQLYLRQQAKTAARVGIDFQDEMLPESTTSISLRSRLATLDQDPTVDAVLLEHPLPPELGFLSAASTLRLEKDVDGVGAASLGRLVAGQPIHAPAVARGAILLARHYGADFLGRRVTVVGRSETVGLPLALLLAARGLGAEATVTIAHSKTRDLVAALSGAEVVFSAVGQPGLLNRSNVPEGAAVVDVGLSSVPDPTAPSGQRGAGDADAASLEGWARALTPVPGGVGPMTVAALMENTVQAWALLGRGQPP